jgi:uncharacterized protein DUF6785/uncharacterized protein DUF6784
MSQALSRPLAPASAEAAPAQAEPFTARVPAWRAPLIAALLIPPGAFCAVYGYVIIQAVHWSQQSLKLGPVFLLFLLVAVNAVLRLLRRKWSLTQGELALIYAMLVVATAIGGIGMVQFHVTGLPALHYFGAANGWTPFLQFTPPFFIPHDPDVVADFFKGNSTLYSERVLREWAMPVLFWTGFLLLLAWTMLCINALIRKQWVDGERLTFPLVQLPMEMIREGGSSPFWKNRLMWAGFLLAGTLESINSVNFLNPAFPYVQIKPIRLEQNFAAVPWSGMGIFAVAFYPFMIGIAYLLTLDVSFSCWFFYLLTKAELALATAAGWKDATGGAALGRAPFIMEQGAGAFLGLALFALWTARGHLAAACRDAVRGGRRQPGEVMSYRLAFLGAISGIMGVTALFAWCGLSFWIALALFLLYFLFQITITRIVVEAGAGWHFAPACNPHQLLFGAVGMQGFGQRDLTMLAYLTWIDLDYRDSPMPHQLEGMKLGQSAGTPMNRVFWALLIAAVVGAISAYWANLHIYYEYGAATAKVRPWITTIGQAPFRQLKNWFTMAQPPDYTTLQAALAGMGVAGLLGIARQQLVWWPFHPIGYAVANTQSMDYMWMPFLIAWGLKAVVLRYGGMQLYRRSLPFFFGLILGDYIVPALWFFFGWSIRTQMYMSFPH